MISAPARANLLGRQSLDGGLRADGHEDGRFDDAMRRVQATTASGAVGREEVEAEWHTCETFSRDPMGSHAKH